MLQSYRRLMAITGRVVGQAKRFAREISQGVKRCIGLVGQAAIEGDRTYRTPLGKIVSLFEPHMALMSQSK